MKRASLCELPIVTYTCAALNICINETYLFDDIINNGTADKDNIIYGDADINPELKDPFLHDFDRDAIRTYKPRNHKDLPKHAQAFLYKDTNLRKDDAWTKA